MSGTYELTPEFSRRQYLLTAGVLAAIAGCPSNDTITSDEDRNGATATPTKTLEVSEESTTTVSPTNTPTPTVTRTSTPAPTASPTETPSDELVITADQTYRQSAVPEFTVINWRDTGELVLENNAGVTLRDMEDNE